MSITGTKPHDLAVREFLAYLIRQGERVSTEVGLPEPGAGRIDLLTYEPDGGWREIFEVKMSNATQAIPQLLRYAEYAIGSPRLTIVVPPAADIDRLHRLAAGYDIGVRVHNFSDTEYRGLPDGPGEYVVVKWFHPEMRAQLSARARGAAV